MERQEIKKKQDIRDNKAITLIALVVTIVVLLILAGVSIGMLAGENGIIRQAIESKDNTRGASAKEEIDLWKSNVKMDSLTGSTTAESKEDLLDRLVENGTLTQEEADKLANKETITIGNSNISLDGTTSNGSGSGDGSGDGDGDDEPKTLADLKQSEDSVEGNTTLEDDNGDKITIPDGFNVDKDSPTVVEEGIVIEDSQENQYVWIPVFEKSDARTWGVDYSAVATAKTAERANFTTADYTAIKNAIETYTTTYNNSSYTDEWYGNENYGQHGYYDGTKFNYYTNGNMDQTEYETLYNNMLVSVYKNGGFYIGRYEMGTGVATSVETAKELTRTRMTEYKASSDRNTSTTVVENGAPSIAGMPTPVSKANAVGYTWITQNQAQMLAKKIGEEYGYGETTSSLMFGVQWDAVCVFLEHYGKLNDGTEFDSSYLTGNTKGKLWGNYENATYTMDRGYYNIYNSTSPYIHPENWTEKTAKTGSGKWLCTTGASEQNKALNIYDFGGNLYEYTLERFSISLDPVTYRGGSFNNVSYASFRHYSNTYYTSYNHSARPALFL